MRGPFEMGDIALLRETFGKHNACTGRAEIFQVTSIVNGVTNFTYVPADGPVRAQSPQYVDGVKP